MSNTASFIERWLWVLFGAVAYSISKVLWDSGLLSVVMAAIAAGLGSALAHALVGRKGKNDGN